MLLFFTFLPQRMPTLARSRPPTATTPLSLPRHEVVRNNSSNNNNQQTAAHTF